MADVINVRRILPDEMRGAQDKGHKWVATALGFPHDFPNGDRRLVTAKTKEEVRSRAIRYVQRANDARQHADHAAELSMRSSGLTHPDRWHARERKLRKKLRSTWFHRVRP